MIAQSKNSDLLGQRHCINPKNSAYVQHSFRVLLGECETSEDTPAIHSTFASRADQPFFAHPCDEDKFISQLAAAVTIVRKHYYVLRKAF